MKSKSEILRHIEEALFLLKGQVLISDELKARTHLKMALAVIEDAEDSESPRSGAV